MNKMPLRRHRDDDYSESEKRLDGLGKAGWELVSVIATQMQVIAFFKRPIPEKETAP
jgi:hypothetical protein